MEDNVPDKAANPKTGIGADPNSIQGPDWNNAVPDKVAPCSICDGDGFITTQMGSIECRACKAEPQAGAQSSRRIEVKKEK